MALSFHGSVSGGTVRASDEGDERVITDMTLSAGRMPPTRLAFEAADALTALAFPPTGGCGPTIG